MPGLRELDSFKHRLFGSCILAMSFWSNEETAELAKGFGAVTLRDKAKLVSTLMTAIEECTPQKSAN